MNPIDLLNQFFDIHPLGVEVCPGADPPKEAWESLVLHLAASNDELAWQVGATCNRYPKKYHADIYGWFATLLGRSHWTIQQWAYIERNVPARVRLEELSIWLHRPVAKINDPKLQREYLLACRAAGWNAAQFEIWLESKGIPPDEHHYQSDRAFDEEQALYNAINQAADAETENALLRAELATIQRIREIEEDFGVDSRIDPTTLPEVSELAQPIIGWLRSQTVNFNAVLIKRNGEVVIKP